MKKLLISAFIFCISVTTLMAQTTCRGPRKMWASINVISNTTTSDNLKKDNGKILLSWRMLPTDKWDTSFYIYSRSTDKPAAMMRRVTATPVVNSTCYQLSDIPSTSLTYFLIKGDITPTGVMVTRADQKKYLMDNCLDSVVLTERIYKDKLPYLSIPLKDTKDVCAIDSIVYQANDVSVGDLDGDGEMEVVVKRLQTSYRASGDGTIRDEFGIGGSYSNPATIYAVIWDAYKLDGTLLWRVKGGPGIILGNSSSFAVADFDGDGCAEMAIRTCEGTVFGDGQEIGDTNGDGKIDYRTWGNLHSSSPGWIDHYNSAGPEFLSIIDGKTGRELARENFINRDTSESWGDGYWKRACSFRIGVGCFDDTGLPSVVVGRGVYARSVIRRYDYRNGKLSIVWTFDSSKSGSGKDGNPNSAYGGQGNHSLNVADLDGDGYDEIMYGSMAIDQDGVGLWTTKLGHGDANHVGKFLPDQPGLQMYHCLESGKTQVALHDAATGAVIWSKVGTSENDKGRCMVADFDPNSPGCEFWMAGSNAFSQKGTDLGYQPSSCNMGIWFDGTLNRQLINENTIDGKVNGRVFTLYRYDESFINGTKSNPNWYGDFLGDWREEIIVSDKTRLKDLKIFSTWLTTDYKFPYLMSDHTYLMSALNENIGYNQPTNLGYYLGSDMDMSQVPLIDHLKGDVNEDGKVDINDVVAVINQMAGTASWRYANVNEDEGGMVDINDVVAIINIMAGN